jgi:hypothetical protein
MNRKASVVLGLVAVVLLVLYLLNRDFHQKQVAPGSTARHAESSAPGQMTASSAQKTTAISVPPGMAVEKSENSPAAAAGLVPPAAPDNSATIAPAIVMQNVRRAVRQYGDMFNGNPVGTNPEITAALSGKNPKQINFIDSNAGMRVNDQGEMIDPWGTPYFFHQISGTQMEIHSAGPDRIMWTSDDLVAQ